ncbi:tRNA dihydrouridine synthase DusB [Bacteroidota bacterium]
MFKIGNINFGEYPLVLAPMEDVTDTIFRLICKQYGVDLMFSEFVASDALIRNVKKIITKTQIHEDEHPFGIQIYGKHVDAMVESVKIVEESRPDLIDINFGCPVKKIAGKGAGAGLLKDIPLMIKMAGSVVKASKLPVTAKTRLGWDEKNKNVVEVAEQLQDVGIQALTIHGRTKTQMYSGEADWALIGEVKNHPRISIPVIGNGDIDSPEKAKEMFNKYGVDAIMIGRASIGRPWIFKEIKHFLKTGEELPAYTINDQVNYLKDHFGKALESKEEKRAILSMRRFFAACFKGIPNFRITRIKLLQSLDRSEVYDILDYISDKYGTMV